MRTAVAAGLAFLLGAWGARETGGEGEERLLRLGFEDVEAGMLPKGWKAAETAGAGTPAAWRVAKDERAAGGSQVLRLAETKNSGSTFNLLLSGESHPADLVLRVRLRADTGEEDQGGGLLWRAKDANNYYVARWNPLEKNLRAYMVQHGKRKMFKSADVETDPKGWHALEVRMTGRKMEVRFDGKLLLEHDDETFPEGGRIGFWTKADAATSFDDLEVEPAGK